MDYAGENTGTGNWDGNGLDPGVDPKNETRKLEKPWPVSQDHSGILAYYHEPSDDGRFALVEYVAYNRSALQAILNDTSITVFIKGVASKSTIETALKQYRKDFDLDKFGVVMP